MGTDKKDLEKAFWDGVRERENASLLDHLGHTLGDLIPCLSKEEEAREAGYHSDKSSRDYKNKE